MILIYDNFDSFTYNLVDYFARIGVKCAIFRNDTPLTEIVCEEYEAVVLSPGPCTPDKAGGLMEILNYYIGRLPILGICLGHQAIGLHFGARLSKAKRPMHGKVSEIQCVPHFLWNRLPTPVKVVRYHSLVLDRVPHCFKVLATTDEGEVMAIAHKELPLCGLQFHPEAVLTESGLAMLNNWVDHYNLKAESNFVIDQKVSLSW
ncbi:aminodeoxychorismate/anthranilate synthase component II [Roseivirga sp. BDSF3-8]|uniref:anthranilate synthase component II n=1 Tax=Roseivirga sp. BDSF3-8 TaxID=3241598 RepID=UPI003531D460